ncbi:MAG: GNAT family N-acetyltransferase [Holophagaceae bacterium]|nr:GNAT family N-acetyltransferase [Holophagaceae bacterium]
MDLQVPEPIATLKGLVAFADETWTIEPKELQIFFQAEAVYWTASRTVEQWRRLLACSRMLTARLQSEEGKGGRLVGTTRVWSDRAYEAKLYDVVTAGDMKGLGIASTLVRWALRHPSTGDVQRFVLETRDAGDLYTRFGFRRSEDVNTVHMRATAADLEKLGLRG